MTIFSFSDIPSDIPVDIDTEAPAATNDPLPGALEDIGTAIAESAAKSDAERADILNQVSHGLDYNPDSQSMYNNLNQHGLPPSQPPPPGEKKEMIIESEGGSNKGGSYRPASFKISEISEPPPAAKAGETTSSNPTAFGYPMGMGPVMKNGCFGKGYKPGTPCYKAKVPVATCREMLDAAAFIGVGFDGRGGYNAQSRKMSLIQR